MSQWSTGSPAMTPPIVSSEEERALLSKTGERPAYTHWNNTKIIISPMSTNPDSMKDMDIIEPNEAFATPCLAFSKEFGYDYFDPRVNPTGGAISIGHPIGASGVIYFTEMVHEMVNRKLKWGIQALCGGGGVGIATVVKRS